MKKVMVVDDAVTVRIYHRSIMESLGYEVEEAENGVEALEKGIGGQHDLYLVDVNMPKMDGYRLVKHMREDPELAAIPVIMVSTESGEQDREQAYEAGANLYVVKPADVESLGQYARLLMEAH